MEPTTSVRCWRRTRSKGIRKQAWRSELAALVRAAWLLEHGGAPQTVYSCPACGWWHLTTRPVRERADVGTRHP